MNVNNYIPSAILRPFINRYVVIESDNEILNRILPDTSLAVAFRFKGEVNYLSDQHVNHLPTSVITGLRKSARLVNYVQGSAAIIVLFKEMGAHFFFRQPLHELFEQSISLDHFISQNQMRIIEERLAGATHHEQRIGIIEELFISIMLDISPDKLVATALQKIHASDGNIKIKTLANELYISQDAFEKRFRKIIGTTPKQFSSIIRMKAIVANMRQKQSFTDIAYDAGFFDQAHFNKEFKLFTGQPPGDFFRSSPAW